MSVCTAQARFSTKISVHVWKMKVINFGYTERLCLKVSAFPQKALCMIPVPKIYGYQTLECMTDSSMKIDYVQVAAGQFAAT